jgi:signal transduction histidine kinase
MSNPPDPRDVGSSLQTDLREALSFLSHNAREGHSSTLALLELQRILPEPMATQVLIDRIERNARNSLAAIDDFMDMVAARTRPLSFEEIDLAELLTELVADAWSLASLHGIRVRMGAGVEAASVRADRQLLAGTINKLLRDSAARTPRGGELLCALTDGATEWIVDIGDPGAPDNLPLVADASPWDGKLPLEGGVGPGLVLAQVVAQRHGGWVRIDAQPGPGRVIKLALPRSS